MFKPAATAGYKPAPPQLGRQMSLWYEDDCRGVLKILFLGHPYNKGLLLFYIAYLNKVFSYLYSVECCALTYLVAY